MDRNKVRAQANLESIRAFEGLDLTRVPDGSYRSKCIGFRGDITVEVVVKDARIESVEIVGHREDRALSAFVAIPRRIVEKQGLNDVDAVTGATVTAHAVLNATANALAGAMK